VFSNTFNSVTPSFIDVTIESGTNKLGDEKTSVTWIGSSSDQVLKSDESSSGEIVILALN
jgi:hypothetical protein